MGSDTSRCSRLCSCPEGGYAGSDKKNKWIKLNSPKTVTCNAVLVHHELQDLFMTHAFKSYVGRYTCKGDVILATLIDAQTFFRSVVVALSEEQCIKYYFEILVDDDYAWVRNYDRKIPFAAIVAGTTSTNEKIYIGRVKNETGIFIPDGRFYKVINVTSTSLEALNRNEYCDILVDQKLIKERELQIQQARERERERVRLQELRIQEERRMQVEREIQQARERERERVRLQELRIQEERRMQIEREIQQARERERERVRKEDVRRQEQLTKQQEEQVAQQIQERTMRNAEHLFEEGQSLYENAWNAEDTDDCTEATSLFKAAKTKFEEAFKVFENQKYIDWANETLAKIDGNQEFNDGFELHQSSSEDTQKLSKVFSKYREAKIKFQQGIICAEKNKNENRKRFEGCIASVKETMDALQLAMTEELGTDFQYLEQSGPESAYTAGASREKSEKYNIII